MNPPAGLPTSIQHYVDGKHVDSLDGGTFPLADPVSDTPYAQVSAGTAADVDRAVQAAHRAFTEGVGRRGAAGAGEGAHPPRRPDRGVG
ncbi:hypothetical protein ACFQ1L_25035 [Phytohabitans flavus]|uniref:hypothetical protein n=1 Tax=Phytohabitans flavus TaxID=1076124 RepID=UPI0036410A0A